MVTKKTDIEQMTGHELDDEISNKAAPSYQDFPPANLLWVRATHKIDFEDDK
jgi:hypothetical protein